MITPRRRNIRTISAIKIYITFVTLGLVGWHCGWKIGQWIDRQTTRDAAHYAQRNFGPNDGVVTLKR